MLTCVAQDAERPALGGDARDRQGTMTVLFTDLVGSAELIWRLGDHAGSAVILGHLARLRGIVATHGGWAVKNLGDALLTAGS